MENTENSYEEVNHPNHYNQYDVEAYEMMRKIWGDEALYNWCTLTAFKYRMRMGLKPSVPTTTDLAKEAFYLDLAKKCKERIDNSNKLIKESIHEA